MTSTEMDRVRDHNGLVHATTVVMDPFGGHTACDLEFSFRGTSTMVSLVDKMFIYRMNRTQSPVNCLACIGS